MILAIGEILFDIFPKYKRLGGAPFNFAFHLKNIGIPVCFISRIGNDTEGGEIVKQLKKYGFEIKNIQIDDKHRTGKVIVRLDGKGVPDFDILPDVAYDYIEFDSEIASLVNENIKLIYFGSLSQRSEHGFKTIQRVLSRRHPATSSLYDVNLRPNCFSMPVITESLKQCDVVKLNDEELRILKEMVSFKKSDRAFTEYLLVRYDIKMLSLTRGGNGSELFTVDQHYRIKSSPLEHIADTVGAGDAYTAVLSIGYMNNWPPERILDQATDFAARICRQKGAIPADPKFYNPMINFLKGNGNEKQ